MMENVASYPIVYVNNGSNHIVDPQGKRLSQEIFI